MGWWSGCFGGHLWFVFAFRDCLGFLFVLIDRNNFDFDGQQFEIEKAKSNGIYDLHNMCITKV